PLQLLLLGNRAGSLHLRWTPRRKEHPTQCHVSARHVFRQLAEPVFEDALHTGALLVSAGAVDELPVPALISRVYPAGAELTQDQAARLAAVRATLPDSNLKKRPGPVLVSAPGFDIDWESAHQTDATFRLVPDLPIVGRVVDLEGKTVAGATVAVHDVH